VAESSQGKEPDWWPRDPAGYIFLSRVVEQFGNALHKDWTGAEVIVIDPLPRSRKDSSQTNLLDAERLLQHYRPDLKRPAVIGSNKFSEKHWKIAYGLAQRLRPALDRLRATQSEIVRKNESGELDLKIRSRNGGPWGDFNKDWWGIKNWRSFFDRCRVDPEYPNGDRPSWNKEDNDHWIFATFRSVEEVLKPPAEEESRKKPASDKEIPKFVSDYIKDNPTTASLSGCRAKWKPLHGSHRRDELDAEWRKQAKAKGLLRERGQRSQIAKS
jgi:hypothetical protein